MKVSGCAIEDDTRRYRGGNGAGIQCSLAAEESQVTESREPEQTKWPFDPNEWRRVHTNEELFANSKPLRADESFAIEDLTEEEWDRFWAALNE